MILHAISLLLYMGLPLQILSKPKLVRQKRTDASTLKRRRQTPSQSDSIPELSYSLQVRLWIFSTYTLFLSSLSHSLSLFLSLSSSHSLTLTPSLYHTHTLSLSSLSLFSSDKYTPGAYGRQSSSRNRVQRYLFHYYIIWKILLCFNWST